MPLVWWLMAGASLRTRWLVSAAWVSLWAMVYALMTLIPLGAHGYRWWVPIIGPSLLIGLATGALAVWTGRSVLESYAVELDGLTVEQRRQLSRVWRRGAVPSDPAVLIAAVRLHDLGEHYRLARRRRRTTGALMGGIGAVLLLITALGEHHRFNPFALGYLVIGVTLLATPTAAALRAKRREPRLAELRAAAQSDPDVAAAVARPARPAGPPTRTHLLWWAVAATTIALAAFGGIEVAKTLTPHRAGCRAVDAVVDEVYSQRDQLFAADAVGPSGPPLSQYRQLADSLRHHAGDADGDPATAPSLDRIADLAAHVLTVVEQARDTAPSGAAIPLADSQIAYFDTLDQLAAEERRAQEQCRR